MLVAEHGRVPHSPVEWQIAVLVLRYFVAVLMVGKSRPESTALGCGWSGL